MDAISSANAVDRGRTYYDGNTIDSADYGGVGLEGSIRVFRDFDPTDRLKLRSARDITCILVRNVSGIALLPGRIVRWKAAFRGKRVDGYTTTTAAEAAGVVDEWLPTAGVPDGDLFWLVVDGPSLVRSDLTGDAGTAFSEGAILIAVTAATSQATSAGRMTEADFTTAATGATLGDQIVNRIGRAMSANTTSQTNRQVLVDVRLL